PIPRVTDFHSQTAVIFVGSEVELEVLRDGRVRRLTLAVSEDQLEKAPGERIDPRLSGTQLQNFRSQDDQSLGAGVLVTEVSNDSRAWQFGLRPGDVIVGLARQPVRDLADFREAARQSGRQLLLRVYRAGQYGYVAIR